MVRNEEVWAAIPGYPGYAVSNRGRVMNVKLNRILDGRTQGGTTVVGIQDENRMLRYFDVAKLMIGCDFSAVDNQVSTRKIRVVETGEVFNNVNEISRALLTDKSSIYKALRGDRPRVMGVTIEWVWG